MNFISAAIAFLSLAKISLASSPEISQCFEEMRDLNHRVCGSKFLYRQPVSPGTAGECRVWFELDMNHETPFTGAVIPSILPGICRWKASSADKTVDANIQVNGRKFLVGCSHVVIPRKPKQVSTSSFGFVEVPSSWDLVPTDTSSPNFRASQHVNSGSARPESDTIFRHKSISICSPLKEYKRQIQLALFPHSLEGGSGYTSFTITLTNHGTDKAWGSLRLWSKREKDNWNIELHGISFLAVRHSLVPVAQFVQDKIVKMIDENFAWDYIDKLGQTPLANREGRDRVEGEVKGDSTVQCKRGTDLLAKFRHERLKLYISLIGPSSTALTDLRPDLWEPNDSCRRLMTLWNEVAAVPIDYRSPPSS
jgi:hypothetical protein